MSRKGVPQFDKWFWTHRTLSGMRVHHRRVAVVLSERLQEQVAAFPETHAGVNAVDVTLRDGRVFPDVEVAWAAEVIRVAGFADIPFTADDISDVQDASGRY